MLLRSIEGSALLGCGGGGAHGMLCSAAWRSVMVQWVAQQAWEGLPVIPELVGWPGAGHCAY